MLWDVPGDTKHPCEPRAGREPRQPRRDGGHGHGSTGLSPLPATRADFCREMCVTRSGGRRAVPFHPGGGTCLRIV